MDAAVMEAWGKFGAAAALGLAGIGSAIGTGTAGMAAVGAWKKAYATGKSAPFTLVTFIGAPLSQTIYGMILMLMMNGVAKATPTSFPLLIGAGVFGGLALGASAWFQGKAGAAASDSLGETGQGFGNYLMTIGVVETVALFVMVFAMMLVKS
ncbi:MAG: V-type ATP synthase subunit K [Spartobacteria bacterium]|nr:V-type ATP synthase subunit K [Spartobacteria bacterium]